MLHSNAILNPFCSEFDWNSGTIQSVPRKPLSLSCFSFIRLLSAANFRSSTKQHTMAKLEFSFPWIIVNRSIGDAIYRSMFVLKAKFDNIMSNWQDGEINVEDELWINMMCVSRNEIHILFFVLYFKIKFIIQKKASNAFNF